MNLSPTSIYTLRYYPFGTFDIDSEASPQRKTFYSLINKNHGIVEEVTIRSNGVEKIGDDNAEVISEKAKKQIKSTKLYMGD